MAADSPAPVPSNLIDSAAAQAPGQYGGYGSYGSYGSYGGYGYGSTSPSPSRPNSRMLLDLPQSQPSWDMQSVKPVNPHLNQGLIGYTFTGQPLMENPMCPPCPTCTDSSQHGTCYCLYDAVTASWRLDDAACQSALYTKCGGAGSLLQCSQLDTFYSAAYGVERPHADDISSFLFVDCAAAAPCSCQHLKLDGSDSSAAQTQCCSDLRAHCQTPFSGLPCEAVESFCATAQKATAASPLIRQFVAVKTHGVDCQKVKSAYSLQPSSEMLEDKLTGMSRQQHADNDNMSIAMLALMIAAGCIAVGLAITGSVVLVQHYMRREYAQPLLSSYH